MHVEVIKAIKKLTPDICQREACFQDYLAVLLGARVRMVVNGIEVDVYGGRFAIEVKVNPRIYDGVGQALAYRRLLGIEEVWLVHIFTYRIDWERWCNDLGRLLMGTSIGYAVVTPTNHCVRAEA